MAQVVRYVARRLQLLVDTEKFRRVFLEPT